MSELAVRCPACGLDLRALLLVDDSQDQQAVVPHQASIARPDQPRWSKKAVVGVTGLIAALIVIAVTRGPRHGGHDTASRHPETATAPGPSIAPRPSGTVTEPAMTASTTAKGLCPVAGFVPNINAPSLDLPTVTAGPPPKLAQRTGVSLVLWGQDPSEAGNHDQLTVVGLDTGRTTAWALPDPEGLSDLTTVDGTVVVSRAGRAATLNAALDGYQWDLGPASAIGVMASLTPGRVWLFRYNDPSATPAIFAREETLTGHLTVAEAALPARYYPLGVTSLGLILGPDDQGDRPVLLWRPGSPPRPIGGNCSFGYVAATVGSIVITQTATPHPVLRLIDLASGAVRVIPLPYGYTGLLDARVSPDGTELAGLQLNGASPGPDAGAVHRLVLLDLRSGRTIVAPEPISACCEVSSWAVAWSTRSDWVVIQGDHGVIYAYHRPENRMFTAVLPPLPDHIALTAR